MPSHSPHFMQRADCRVCGKGAETRGSEDGRSCEARGEANESRRDGGEVEARSRRDQGLREVEANGDGYRARASSSSCLRARLLR